MKLCDYGCGQEAKYQFKNGKWCCGNNIAKCPRIRAISSNKLQGKKKTKIHRKHLSESKKGNIPWNKGKTGLQIPWNKGKIGIYSKDSLEKMSNSSKGKTAWNKGTKGKMIAWNKGKTGIYSKEILNKISNKQKLTIEQIKERYPFFSKIEEMRYNPKKLTEEKEIQVHCKNHECENSKEKGGWFNPTKIQLHERIRALEKPYGMIENNLYCSQKCKDECPLYYLRSDPYRDTTLPYTAAELQTYNKFVMKRENGLCEYCGEKAEHVHHIRPQKLEPFFALDPDFGIATCKICHYKYGHQDECSTGVLAAKRCNND